MKYTLTSNEVAALCGITANTVKHYVENGHIAPEREVKSGGPGCGRLFSAVQALAMVYAQQYKQAGMDGPAINTMMTAISQMSLKEIKTRIENGETVVFPVQQDHSQKPKEVWVQKPLWLSLNGLDKIVESKKERATWRSLNIVTAWEKVRQALGDKYRDLKPPSEATINTKEDELVAFLKETRRVAHNNVNFKDVKPRPERCKMTEGDTPMQKRLKKGKKTKKNRKSR